MSPTTHSEHCVTEPDIMTGTGIKARTRNMTGPGPRLGPEMGRDQDQGTGPALVRDRDRVSAIINHLATCIQKLHTAEVL